MEISLDDVGVLEDANEVLSQKQSLVKDVGGSILLQFTPPSIQLVIVGAGNDVQPLADMAFIGVECCDR